MIIIYNCRKLLWNFSIWFKILHSRARAHNYFPYRRNKGIRVVIELFNNGNVFCLLSIRSLKLLVMRSEFI